MSHLFKLFIALILVLVPIVGFANNEQQNAEGVQISPEEVQQQFDEANKITIAAAVSTAAYNDRNAQMVKHYLEQNGWKFGTDKEIAEQVNNKFILVKRIDKEGVPVYFLGIAGTENLSDIKKDLRLEKVYFAGVNSRELRDNAETSDVPDTEPKVHRGFHQITYMQSFCRVKNEQEGNASILESLLKEEQAKIYITGHSSGGAVAILTAAVLIEAGINPEDIEVITFASPAVGNQAFVDKYKDTIKLTRVVISGDAVPHMIQKMDGSYKQFGTEFVQQRSDSAFVDKSHRMYGYLDVSLKNYYDIRRMAIDNNIEIANRFETKKIDLGTVYIVPLRNELPHGLQSEFYYMREAVEDEYDRTIKDYIYETEDIDNVPMILERARKSGCRVVMVSQAQATMVKDKLNIYYVTLNQTIYDSENGSVLNTAIFSTRTQEITPLEAFLHSFKGLNASLRQKAVHETEEIKKAS